VNISRPFIERPVATTLLMAGLFLVGLAAFPFLPVAPLPQIDFPTLLVSAQLPGASRWRRNSRRSRAWRR
jgi:multidrug efflux pump subunit AcrB